MDYIRIVNFMKMKTIFTLVFSVLFGLSNTMAQCTPDQSMVVPGISPNRLADATVGVPYSQVISLLVPKDTVLNIGGTVYNVTVDSAVVLSIENYPSEFTYETNSPNMTWAGGARGCARIYGVATEKDVQTWAILVKVYTYFKIKGLSNQLEKLDQSTIDFKVVMPSAIEQISIQNIASYPNPANNEISVHLPQMVQINQVKLFDLMGRGFDMTKSATIDENNLVLDISALPSSAYFIELTSNSGKVFHSKFVKTAY